MTTFRLNNTAVYLGRTIGAISTAATPNDEEDDHEYDYKGNDNAGDKFQLGGSDRVEQIVTFARHGALLQVGYQLIAAGFLIWVGEDFSIENTFRKSSELTLSILSHSS